MQWTNTDQVLSWFVGFKEQKYSFFNGFNDMVNYYSSISEELVIKTLNFADRYISVPAGELNLIKNACKLVLCEQGALSRKKGVKSTNSLFDVVQGPYTDAEQCELVGLFVRRVNGN